VGFVECLNKCFFSFLFLYQVSDEASGERYGRARRIGEQSRSREYEV
jgi:hypothetical protein